MVSKSSAVRSVRLQNDIWEWLAVEAERRQTNVNGLVSDLLIVARLKAEEARLAPPKPAKAEKRYNEQAGPSLNDAPPPKPAEPKAEAGATPPKFNIQIGPIERKPGSMLKKGK